jgi:hypothetical protein
MHPIFGALKIGGKLFKTIGPKIGLKYTAKTPKFIVKSIPYVGLIVGCGFGIWRCIKGDFKNATLELASGAASCFPGIGTYITFGIESLLLSKDIKSQID